jgi:hypothetical protein
VLEYLVIRKKGLGWMTGFEFHPTPPTIKQIKHLPRQIQEKRGKKYANLQPNATKILTIKKGWLPINPTRMKNDEPALAASASRPIF